jgi:acetylornithine deacetylase/succinyl-diaminopimelate desuccinylase-like protein
VHKPNEHTRISELHRAVELYRDVIERLVGAGGASCS